VLLYTQQVVAAAVMKLFTHILQAQEAHKTEQVIAVVLQVTAHWLQQQAEQIEAVVVVVQAIRRRMPAALVALEWSL
jgi:KaiC/GvpD/RAD55 family RecA-like ATPase